MVHGGGLAVWGLLIRRHPKLTEHRAMIHVVACHVLSPSRDPLPGGTAPRAFLSAVGGITAECHGQRGPRSLAVARGAPAGIPGLTRKKQCGRRASTDPVARRLSRGPGPRCAQALAGHLAAVTIGSTRPGGGSGCPGPMTTTWLWRGRASMVAQWPPCLGARGAGCAAGAAGRRGVV